MDKAKKIFVGIIFSLTSSAPLRGQWNAVGSANMITCQEWQLTPDANNQSGAIWNLVQVNLNYPFSYSGQVFLGCNDGGADGIAFVLQTVSSGAGGAGGGIGYAGLSPSFAVEIDTWQNGGAGDPSCDHIAIQKNGDVNHSGANNLAGPICLPNVEDCQWYDFTVTWDPSTYTFTFCINAGGWVCISWTGNMVNTIFGGDSTVFMGFTAATGGAKNDQRVRFPFSVQLLGKKDVLCNGADDGWIKVTGVGGQQPFSYLWSNGASVDSIFNLTAGTYCVTVTEANGCWDSMCVQISEPPAITASVSVTSVTCSGVNNGSITITANGGTPNYDFIWSGGSSTGVSPGTPVILTGLSGGIHSILIYDSNGCQLVENVIINQPSPVTASVIVYPASCNGSSDGSITVTASGGTPPYSITCSCGNSTNTGQGIPVVFPGLSAGTYQLTLADASGCIHIDTVTVNEPPPLSISSTASPATCSGAANGMATVTVTGGTPNYTLIWSSGTSTNVGSGIPVTITGLTAGTHAVIVKDLNNCSDTHYVQINQPPGMSYTILTTSVTCNGGTDGAITITAGGGTPPYTFDWGQSTSSGIPQGNPVIITGIGAGTYSITITDNSGCVTVASTTINEPSPITVIAYGDTTICKGGTATLTCQAYGGIPPYTYIWDNGMNGSTIQVSPSNPECHSAYVIDANGCISSPSQQVCIDFFPGVQVNVLPEQHSVCPGEQAFFSAMATGGKGPPYSFAWSTGQNGPSVYISPQGTYPDTLIYYVVAQDVCGSKDTSFVTITFLQPPSIDFTTDLREGCQPLSVSFTPLTQNASQCLWELGDGSTYAGCSTFSHTYSSSGLFSVKAIAISPDGCTDTIIKSNYITVRPLPQAYFVADPWEVTQMDPRVQFSDLSLSTDPLIWWKWTFYDKDGNTILDSSLFQNPSYVFPFEAPDDTGLYPVKLEVKTIYGCHDDTSLAVLMKPEFAIYLPNSFTPDGDGINDVFGPTGIGISPNGFEMYIFNRWGEMIYHTSDITNPWDGRTINNKQAPEGVYIWKIRIRDTKKKALHFYTGHVVLLR